MKVGGGLNFVTGPMGAGKSLYAVRRIVEALTAGQYVVTNVELLPGWEHRVAAHVGRFSAPSSRRRIASKVRSYYVFENELREAQRYRVPGSGEARARFVWDEGHNDLNNRRWRDEGREAILEWATQLRKLGFVGFLLSQHADNTDAALRRVCNYHVRLQNQREQTRAFGIRITPWPLFVAWWYPAHLGQRSTVIKAVRTERYFLSWHRHLYDTFGLYHGLAGADAEDTRLLPVGGLPASSAGAAAPAAAPLSPVCSLGCCQLPAWARFDPHDGAAVLPVSAATPPLTPTGGGVVALPGASRGDLQAFSGLHPDPVNAERPRLSPEAAPKHSGADSPDAAASG